MAFPRAGGIARDNLSSCSSTTISLMAGHCRDDFGDLVDIGVEEEVEVV